MVPFAKDQIQIRTALNTPEFGNCLVVSLNLHCSIEVWFEIKAEEREIRIRGKEQHCRSQDIRHRRHARLRLPRLDRLHRRRVPVRLAGKPASAFHVTIDYDKSPGASFER